MKRAFSVMGHALVISCKNSGGWRSICGSDVPRHMAFGAALGNTWQQVTPVVMCDPPTAF